MEGDLRAVWQECARLAKRGERAAYALVVRVGGSGPQVAGARLVLGASGRFAGTVGGGAVEAAVLADAARIRDGDGPAEVHAYHLAAELGMCCGGTMDLLIDRVSPGDAAYWATVAEHEHNEGGTFALVTSGASFAQMGARLWIHGERVVAAGLSEEAIGHLRNVIHAATPAAPTCLDCIAPDGAALALFMEPLEASRRMILFGGGHVAKPIAQLAHLLGYEVSVVDDREEWASSSRFPGATLIHEPYVDYLFRFEPRPNDTLLIVTRGHDFDQDVLAALVDKPSRYLGLIGSRAKVKRAFLRLRAAGVSEALLDRVHAPMGLDLGAQTPEEIAVAVAAELVQERRGKPRPPSVPGWWRTPP